MRVHDIQAYRKMDEKGSASVVSWNREILSFETCFNLVSAAVACAILESIWGLEPSSVITELRYLKPVTHHVMKYFHGRNQKPCLIRGKSEQQTEF